MIKTAISLQEAVDKFCEVYQEELIQGDILSDDDWKVLTEIKAFLKKIEAAMKAIEGSNVCIDLTLPNFEFILKIFETIKALNTDDKVIAPIVNSG